MIIGIVNVQSGLSLDFKQGGDSLSGESAQQNMRTMNLLSSTQKLSGGNKLSVKKHHWLFCKHDSN